MIAVAAKVGVGGANGLDLGPERRAPASGTAAPRQSRSRRPCRPAHRPTARPASRAPRPRDHTPAGRQDQPRRHRRRRRTRRPAPKGGGVPIAPDQSMPTKRVNLTPTAWRPGGAPIRPGARQFAPHGRAGWGCRRFPPPCRRASNRRRKSRLRRHGHRHSPCRNPRSFIIRVGALRIWAGGFSEPVAMADFFAAFSAL